MNFINKKKQQQHRWLLGLFHGNEPLLCPFTWLQSKTRPTKSINPLKIGALEGNQREEKLNIFLLA